MKKHPMEPSSEVLKKFMSKGKSDKKIKIKK